MGTHLAIVTQEMEQLKWRALGLVWCVPQRKYTGFLKALSAFDALCLASRIRGCSVSMDYQFTQVLIISGILYKIKFDCHICTFDLFLQ